MTKVIPFPGIIHVEINVGIFKSTSVIDDTGPRSLVCGAGTRIYIVDVLGSDGRRIDMWSGFNLDEAKQVAHDVAIDFGGHLRVFEGEAA